MKRVLIIVFSAVAILSASLMWLNFVTLGQRPWNNRGYTRAEILHFAKEEQILAHKNGYLIDRTDLRSDENQPGDNTMTMPLYRVFDRSGRQLAQHCCFESVPGFIDSTAQNPRWSKPQELRRLSDFLSHIRLLESNEVPQLNTADNSDYTILYYWDTTLLYNIQKFRAFLERCQHMPWRCTVISVNANIISDKKAVQSE